MIERNLHAIRLERDHSDSVPPVEAWSLILRSNFEIKKRLYLCYCVLISSNMLTGNNARQTKTTLFASSQRRRSPVSYAAILGPPSTLLLSSKLIIRLFYLAVCHLTQALRDCHSEKNKKRNLITPWRLQATNTQNAATLTTLTKSMLRLLSCWWDAVWLWGRGRSSICDAECLFVSPDGKSCAGQWDQADV